jgi:hypothetical protein
VGQGQHSVRGITFSLSVRLGLTRGISWRHQLVLERRRDNGKRARLHLHCGQRLPSESNIHRLYSASRTGNDQGRLAPNVLNHLRGGETDVTDLRLRLPTLVESEVSRSARIVAMTLTMQLLLALIWTRMTTCIMAFFLWGAFLILFGPCTDIHVVRNLSSTRRGGQCLRWLLFPRPIVRFTCSQKVQNQNLQFSGVRSHGPWTGAIRLVTFQVRRT